MSLVERVRRKFLHDLPQLLYFPWCVPPLLSFPEKPAFKLGVNLFFFKSPAEKVSLFGWHSCYPFGDLHHLFLIEKNASCLGEYSTQETITGDGPPFPTAEESFFHAALGRAGPNKS
ncbi:hypothetical protein ES703_112586 [subsurface metagenome]